MPVRHEKIKNNFFNFYRLENKTQHSHMIIMRGWGFMTKQHAYAMIAYRNNLLR